MDDSGVPFCKASYIAEGEPPLILTTDNIFSNLEKHIDNGYGKIYSVLLTEKLNLFWIPNKI